MISALLLMSLAQTQAGLAAFAAVDEYKWCARDRAVAYAASGEPAEVIVTVALEGCAYKRATVDAAMAQAPERALGPLQEYLDRIPKWLMVDVVAEKARLSRASAR